jgi:tetratricopeptide (TPR) repeat protein
MSFQGDVGGIGLADLLQSLARGREGVLSLIGKDGAKSTLGVQGGLLHLLPDPDEDPEVWRTCARQSWVKDPDFRIDSLRMVEIAKAHRIETLYRMLDSDGVHFRFAHGPLPERPSESALSPSESGEERKGPRRDAVYLPGMPVEGVLLEYARLKDEAQSAGGIRSLSPDVVLIVLDGASVPRELNRMYAEIDGTSSVSEIADRLGWPLRQMLINSITELRRGSLRAATWEELLILSQRELSRGSNDRASARLRAWCDSAPFGPLSTVDAEIFQSEWDQGRLQPVLRALPARTARTLLRRLDGALGVPLAALDHWGQLAHAREDDRIAQVRLVHMQVIASADPNVPSVRDLLAMSRAFFEDKRRFAAAAVLRIAATKAPETASVRLEIGTGLIQAGLPAEGGPWILEAVTSLFEAGHYEKALPPLKALVESDPSNREARRLLGRARAHGLQRTLVKKNSLVTIAVIVALSIGAVVQFRSQRQFDNKLEAVKSRMDDPREALRILDIEFPGDESNRVRDLRATLVEKNKVLDATVRTSWTDQYREAQVECTIGDPLLGLRRALEMPPPPELSPDEDPLPLASDLFNGLAARIETQLKDLGSKVEDTPAQVRAESKVRTLIDELRVPLAEPGLPTVAKEFDARLHEFAARIDERQERRATERAKALEQDKLSHQDVLLAAARAHAQAGDYSRARASYKRLVDDDPTGKLAVLLAKEIQTIEAKSQALGRAREQALAGQHAAARKTLAGSVENPDEYLLPWKVSSFPARARARLPDGTERVTPFVLESTFGERVRMTLELEGHEPIVLEVDKPGDRFLWFSRLPERAWPAPGRVEALPVSLAEDHFVCDRTGRIARLSKGSNVVWHHELQSLGGIARAPAFLPKLPGNLLLLTEDGDAFVVSGSDGTIEGPYSVGSPPVEGPVSTEEGVRARFRDGSVLEWKTRLKPETITGEVSPSEQEHGDDGAVAGTSAGLAVLRRRTSSATSLESPWTELNLEIGAEVYSVRVPGATDPLFTVRRNGDWTYVAWEAPHALIPRGRLWISDGKGLRSFTP